MWIFHDMQSARVVVHYGYRAGYQRQAHANLIVYSLLFCHVAWYAKAPCATESFAGRTRPYQIEVVGCVLLLVIVPHAAMVCWRVAKFVRNVDTHHVETALFQRSSDAPTARVQIECPAHVVVCVLLKLSRFDLITTNRNENLCCPFTTQNTCGVINNPFNFYTLGRLSSTFSYLNSCVVSLCGVYFDANKAMASWHRLR